MEVIKITLKNNDSSKEILETLSSDLCTAKKIILVCPRDFSLVTDIKFLKKLKAVFLKNKKEIIFVIEQEFLRDSITKQKFEVYKKVPKAFSKTEEKTISDFKTTVLAKKNVKIKKEKKEKSTEPLKFNTKKITAGLPSKSIRGYFFFGIILIIILLLTFYFWISPSAKIIIKPKIAAVPITQNVIIKLPEAEIPQENEELPIIQGIFVETEIVGSEKFATSGRTYEVTNSFGQVSLFNETNEPKFLLPSRLSTEDNVVFRFKKSVIIPPRTDNKPGQLIVDVFADEYDEKDNPIGNRGNIMAGTSLFFPALRKDSREIYYAKANRGPLVSGSTLTHYFLREPDFTTSEELLTETFRFRGIQKLEKEIENQSFREKENYILLNDPRLLKSELLNVVFPLDQVDKEMQTFEISGKLKLSGLVFNQKDVSKFLEKKALASLDKRKKLIKIDPTSAQFRLLEFENFLEKKWVKLSVTMIGIETLDINSKAKKASLWRETLKKEISGKDKKEVMGILMNRPEIDNILDINISPFWQKKLPIIFDQINFEILE